MKQTFSRELRQALGSVSTKSVMNPALWLCGLISLPVFTLSFFATGLMQVAFFAVGLIPLGIALHLFIKYSDRPELLQSEEYRIKDQALRVYGDSEQKDTRALPAIINNQPLLSLQDMRDFESSRTT